MINEIISQSVRVCILHSYKIICIILDLNNTQKLSAKFNKSNASTNFKTCVLYVARPYDFKHNIPSNMDKITVVIFVSLARATIIDSCHVDISRSLPKLRIRNVIDARTNSVRPV